MQKFTDFLWDALQKIEEVFVVNPPEQQQDAVSNFQESQLEHSIGPNS